MAKGLNIHRYGLSPALSLLKRLEEEEERRQRGEKGKAAEDKNAEPEKVREDNLQ